MNERTTTYIGIYTTPELKKALQKAAREDNRALASYCRLLLEKLMREQGRFGKDGKK